MSTNSRRRNKRTHDDDDDNNNNSNTREQGEEWRLEDIFTPLADIGQTEASNKHARAKWHNVVSVMLAGNTPRYILRHYMHKAALEIEIELRNRDSAQMGSPHIDIHDPLELQAEIERRMSVYFAKLEAVKSAAPDDAEERREECEETYRVLQVYSAMAETLACRGVPDYSKMLVTTQALFFCLVHMSRELQATLFKATHRWRLPQHVPITDRREISDFMFVLRTLTPLYTGGVLNSNEYVDKLRKFAFWGSLEIDDLEWTDGGGGNPPNSPDKQEQDEQ